MSLKWTKCCKGRKCPEIAVEGNKVHIKDDFGNQVVVDKANVPFFQDPDDIPDDPMDLNRQMIRIHGNDSKSTVRMTLPQFYEVLQALDKKPSMEAVVEEQPPEEPKKVAKKKKVTKKKTKKKKKKVTK